MFMRTPGKGVMRFENLKPMIPPPIRSAGHKDADDGFPQTLNYVAAVIVVGEILRRDVDACTREHLVTDDALYADVHILADGPAIGEVAVAPRNRGSITEDAVFSLTRAAHPTPTHRTLAT